jgi:ATP-dependent Clp protease protease subunit
MHTGQPYDKVARDTDRDYYLTAEEAVDYGLIDSVMEPDTETADSASA